MSHKVYKAYNLKLKREETMVNPTLKKYVKNGRTTHMLKAVGSDGTDIYRIIGKVDAASFKAGKPCSPRRSSSKRRSSSVKRRSSKRRSSSTRRRKSSRKSSRGGSRKSRKSRKSHRKRKTTKKRSASKKVRRSSRKRRSSTKFSFF
jgi:hypothetical protein